MYRTDFLDLVYSNFTCNVTRDELPLVKEDVFHPSLAISFDLKCSRQVKPE